MTHFDSFQYRGDYDDIQILLRDYQVEEYLRSHSVNRNETVSNAREQLMRDGIQLNANITPRAFKIVQSVFETLRMDIDYEIFCIQDSAINAFAILEGDTRIIGLTSGTLEKLEDREIQFIIGHELGHFIFQHNKYLALLNNNPQSPDVTVLPYLGERLFLNWRKKSELSADRIGYLACGSIEDSSRALIKSGFGLSEKNLNLDLKALMNQIEAIKASPSLLNASFRSHPILPLRLQSLHLFAQGYETGWESGKEAVENEIDSLFAIFRRYPHKKVHEAVMHVIATAGVDLISSERQVLDEEIRTLVTILHQNFTDNPETEIIIDEKKRKTRLKNAIELINQENQETFKTFIISRLAEIAIADGKLLEAEGGVIIEIAGMLKLPPQTAYSILVGAAQTNGFKVDAQMNGIVKKIKNHLNQRI